MPWPVQVHSRTARLVYLPSYHARYEHGVRYTPGRMDIVAQEFEALIGGTQTGRVMSELHPSPAKAQVRSGQGRLCAAARPV